MLVWCVFVSYVSTCGMRMCVGCGCTFVQLVYVACVSDVAHCGLHLVFVLYACVHVHYVCVLFVGCVCCVILHT